jgi:hypothetical protein
LWLCATPASPACNASRSDAGKGYAKSGKAKISRKDPARNASVGSETSHEANQALDLFLSKISVRRHGTAFADGDTPTLDHGPDPVIRGSSLPSRVSKILWFLSQTGRCWAIAFSVSPMTDKAAGLKQLLPVRLIGLLKQSEAGSAFVGRRC